MKIILPLVPFFFFHQERGMQVIKHPKIGPELHFYLFVLKAQLSQVLEEVGNHKQRAEMVSVHLLVWFFNRFTEQSHVPSSVPNILKLTVKKACQSLYRYCWSWHAVSTLTWNKLWMRSSGLSPFWGQFPLSLLAVLDQKQAFNFILN